MTNYSESEIAHLTARIREHIEFDERNAREAQEAVEVKEELSISQKIAELIKQIFGSFSEGIYKRVISLLHLE
jgi:hypothetical protein